MIVLGRNNKRAFTTLDGPFEWTLDFVVYRRGETEPVGTSSHDIFFSRTITLELPLEEGEYVVHVRLDRFQAKSKSFFADKFDDWGVRKMNKTWMIMAQNASIASSVFTVTIFSTR
jgi:hypothetical protein